MTTDVSSESEWRSLDLLRAIAVLFVIISHVPYERFGLTLPHFFYLQALGLLGVLMFFVHTALVLMLSLERQVLQLGGLRRIHVIFLIRRVFRVYPLSVVIVAASAVLGVKGMQHPGFDGHLSWVVYDLLLVQNVTETPSNPLALWSLPFEMQMYLVLPALFAVLRYAARQGPLLIAVLWAGTIAMVVAMQRLGWRYDLVKYVPCFLPGVMAYALTRRRLPAFPSWVLFGFVGLAGVMYPVLVARGMKEHALGPFVCLAIGVLLPMSRDMRPGPLARIAKTVAKYSYGIYLTHSLALWLCFDVMSWMQPIGSFLAWIIAVWVLSWAAYRFIEAPGLQYGKDLARRLAPHG